MGAEVCKLDTGEGEVSGSSSLETYLRKTFQKSRLKR